MSDSTTRDTAACVRCGNALGPDDFFEDGETRPYIIHNGDEPDERTEGPLCMRDFRVGVGLGVTDEAARNRVAEQVAAHYEWSVGKARAVLDAVIEAYQKETRRGR